jgi:hypothetical protein
MAEIFGLQQVTYGTKMAEASAPVSFIASATLLKTGLSRCVSPAFLGFVPPTTLVPLVVSAVSSSAVRRWTDHIRLLDWHGTCSTGSDKFKVEHRDNNSRSLLPREALIDHFGIASYPEVLYRFRVC